MPLALNPGAGWPEGAVLLSSPEQAEQARRAGWEVRALPVENPPMPPTGSYRGAITASPEQLAGARSVLGGRRKVYQFHPAGRGGAREFAKKARGLGPVERVGLFEQEDPFGRVVPVVYVDLTRSDPTFKGMLTQMACRRGGWDEEPGA